MRIIKAGFEILTPISEGGIKELQHIEKIARKCYQSEDLITEDGESAKKIVKMLVEKEHLAMIEHAPTISVSFTVDRGISHEIIRHRLVSFAQESTRYCNYSKNKFSNEITFIKPFFFEDNSKEYEDWVNACKIAEIDYFNLLGKGATPQEARSVLPNSLKTEIVMTANYREWINFFKLRTTKAAHPQMREVTIPLLKEFQKRIPIIFDGIEVEE